MKADKLLSLVDRKMVIDLATEMVNTASPTGEEGDMARLLARVYKEVGLRPQLRTFMTTATTHWSPRGYGRYERF